MTVEVERRSIGQGREGGLGPLLDRTLGVLAAILLFGMAVMITADVLGRNLFNAPVPGSYELTSMLLAALVFVGLPLATERDEHIVVDLFDHLLPKAVVRILSGIMDLLSAVVLAVFAWQLWERGISLAQTGDVTNSLRLPLFPVAYLMAATTGLAALISLVKAATRRYASSD